MNTQTAMSSIQSFPPARQPDDVAPTTRRVPIAAACHAICIRLPADTRLDALASRFADWIANAPKSAGDDVPPRLWVELAPSGAGALRRLGLSLAGVREVLDARHAVTRDVRADASIAGEPLGAALRRCTFGAAFDWARTGAARAVAADVATGETWVAGLLPDDWRPEMLSAEIGIVLSRFDAE
jgi:hypothetical protein